MIGSGARVDLIDGSGCFTCVGAFSLGSVDGIMDGSTVDNDDGANGTEKLPAFSVLIWIVSSVNVWQQ